MTRREYEHQQILAALAVPAVRRKFAWQSDMTFDEIRVARERERQLIAAAEREAERRHRRRDFA